MRRFLLLAVCVVSLAAFAGCDDKKSTGGSSGGPNDPMKSSTGGPAKT